MTKKEFIRECRLRGYCSVKLAREYTRRNKKDEYTEEDLRKCYEIDEERYLYENYRFLHHDSSDGTIN